jgi:hypothetical protein
MGYSFLVWNVEHFRGGQQRLDKVNDLIDHFMPDVFGILEFEAKDQARSLVNDHFYEYDFAFTDSKQEIEILVGWKRGKFDQVIYTQRREFQVNNSFLRPGGLFSFKQNGSNVFENILFLHTDSGTTQKDYDNRQAMFKKIWSMKKSIETLPSQQGQARFLVMGDLNTMGRKKLGPSKPSIRSKDEIDTLKSDAQQNGMEVIQKSHQKTWSDSSGSKKSELDHVIVSSDIALRPRPVPGGDVDPAKIEVYGWNRLTGQAKISFIKNISDHCALYGEVE